MPYADMNSGGVTEAEIHITIRILPEILLLHVADTVSNKFL